MRSSWGAVAAVGLTSTLLLFVPSSRPFAQDSMLRNIELCNGSDRNSAESQIKGCTALINSGAPTSFGLAIAYNNRGNAYANSAEYDRAIEDYDHSLELNPRYVRAYNNRGVAYEKKREFGRAIENYDAATQLDSSYVIAVANRAGAFTKKREYERAVRDYDTVIKLQPSSKEGWRGRCWAHAQLGDLNAALKDCNEAIRLGPDFAVYDSRGFTYLRMNQLDLAIADYSTALGMNPKLAPSLYGRGLAKLKKGDKGGGNMDLTAAKAVDSNIANEFKHYRIKGE